MLKRHLALHLNSQDNVATLLEVAKQGELIAVNDCKGTTLKVLEAVEEVPCGHKIAIEDIPAGANVIKYGEVIGRSISDIQAGAYVHIHNLESLRGRGDLNEQN